MGKWKINFRLKGNKRWLKSKGTYKTKAHAMRDKISFTKSNFITKKFDIKIKKEK